MALKNILLLGMAVGLLSLAVPAREARAQSSQNDECAGGWCGSPNMTGGGGCGCGGGGSILINMTDDGKTYQHTDDWDADGVPDQIDNCPYVKNRDQVDTDADGVGDACDNCPLAANKDQSDVNANSIGDVCDKDADGDGIDNVVDNCWLVPNPGQEACSAKSADCHVTALRDPKSGLPVGDVCNPDMDGDGVTNEKDNCPLVYNPDQKSDGFFGKACDYDADKDGIQNAQDNCPAAYNPDQKRTLPVNDKDPKYGRAGDACNPDIDADGILNNVDNCPLVANRDQADSDHDGVGDACSHRFCFVVERQDRDACLDPTNTFQVYSPTLPFMQPNGQVDPELDPVTGKPLMLHLFANRKGAAFRYTWTDASRPVGSNAAVEHPQGAVSRSTPWEYHYQTDGVATFTPDMPGRYVLKISAELMFADQVNTTWPRNSEYQVTINAKGDALGAGCQAANTGRGPGLAGLAALLGLLYYLVYRRRSA